jgi:hypothetical protein
MRVRHNGQFDDPALRPRREHPKQFGKLPAHFLLQRPALTLRDENRVLFANHMLTNLCFENGRRG